ncbi:MAG: A/G-specific adenine glycosylase [Gammaproteobacteria bacterium GWF2_41_13]|nr:MAG: A/G-specific adenine glycosylase [Gammaproteobacteria bacterium GWF2_41_13]
MITVKQFQKKILTWFEHHGRKELPWQKDITPYRVWISEIMLQQTQVSTVIDYFNRFIERFPTIEILASSSLDEVFAYWAGLGYYARARNLHRTAQWIHQHNQDQFPDAQEALEQLPGIGRSTAGAILSLGMKKQGVILDGNVKRILIRAHKIESPSTTTSTIKQLWTLAEQYTPRHEVEKYNQAMMDIGALICTRTQPKCTECPLEKHCLAHRNHCEEFLPLKTVKKKSPIKKTYMVIAQNDCHQILLEKRPPKGIWGGLWCLPLFETMSSLKKHYQQNKTKKLPPFRHTFTHFHLDIVPIMIALPLSFTLEKQERFFSLSDALKQGIPAPIKKILSEKIFS